MNVICKVRHGSHLYGLDTAESDVDYKGIFLPSFEDLVTCRASHEFRQSTGSKHGKNTKDDVDTVFWSLQKFIKMACDGETAVIDIIHCNDENLIETSPIWQFIVENRSRFYTKNMKAYLGYVKKQAHKYSIKGSRVRALEETIALLKSMSFDAMRLNDPSLLVKLKKLAANNEHIQLVNGFYKGSKWIDKQMLFVGTAKYETTLRVWYVLAELEQSYNNYGHRAKLAKENKSLDTKALSHAIRAGLQLKEIYQTGDLKYPLKDKQFLLDVKQGKLDFSTEIAPVLENIVDEVNELAEKSDYPETVDKTFWNEFVVRCYQGEFD